MTTAKCLGIWMDHSTAHLMEFGTGPIETKTIESGFTHEVKEDSIEKSEHLMHNKEQQQQWDFYKKIGKIVENYVEVFLFGPTDAKKELYNVLKANHAFDNIKIELKQTDKMSENQQLAFVRDHFSKP